VVAACGVGLRDRGPAASAASPSGARVGLRSVSYNSEAVSAYLGATQQRSSFSSSDRQKTRRPREGEKAGNRRPRRS
jgi:hypothetical protein